MRLTETVQRGGHRSVLPDPKASSGHSPRPARQRQLASCCCCRPSAAGHSKRPAPGLVGTGARSLAACGQGCDQRHSLCSDDQAYQRDEKSIAKSSAWRCASMWAFIVVVLCTRCDPGVLKVRLVFHAVGALFAVLGSCRAARTARARCARARRRPAPSWCCAARIRRGQSRSPWKPPWTRSTCSSCHTCWWCPPARGISFPNSDTVRHQVYSFSPVKRLELPLYRGKPFAPQAFDVAGVVTIGCNIHDSMRAYVYVVDAQYFGRTDATGIWEGGRCAAWCIHRAGVASEVTRNKAGARAEDHCLSGRAAVHIEVRHAAAPAGRIAGACQLGCLLT